MKRPEEIICYYSAMTQKKNEQNADNKKNSSIFHQLRSIGTAYLIRFILFSNNSNSE